MNELWIKQPDHGSAAYCATHRCLLGGEVDHLHWVAKVKIARVQRPNTCQGRHDTQGAIVAASVRHGISVGTERDGRQLRYLASIDADAVAGLVSPDLQAQLPHLRFYPAASFLIGRGVGDAVDTAVKGSSDSTQAV